jgi:hypothetical protein
MALLVTRGLVVMMTDHDGCTILWPTTDWITAETLGESDIAAK